MAVQRLEESLTLYPESRLTRMWLAEAYRASGEASSACDSYRIALQDDDDPYHFRKDPVVWLAFAQVLAVNRLKEDALAAFKQTASLRSDLLPDGYADKVSKDNISESIDGFMGLLMLSTNNKPGAQKYLLKAQQACRRTRLSLKD